MATRYLKIEVTKELVTDVCIAVDDEKIPVLPRCEKYLGPNSIEITHDLRRLALLAAEEVPDYDWEPQEYISAGPITEITADEVQKQQLPVEDYTAAVVQVPPSQPEGGAS